MANKDYVKMDLPGAMKPILCPKCKVTPTILKLVESGSVPRGYVGCRCGVFVGEDYQAALKHWENWTTSGR